MKGRYDAIASINAQLWAQAMCGTWASERGLVWIAGNGIPGHDVNLGALSRGDRLAQVTVPRSVFALPPASLRSVIEGTLSAAHLKLLEPQA